MAAYIYVRNVRRGAAFARKLARRLGIGVVDVEVMPRLAHGNSLICWGTSTHPQWRTPRQYTWLANTPDHVAVAAHKIRAFNTLSAGGVPSLDYTPHRNVAVDWFRQGTSIYARQVLQGHSGEGLVFISTEENDERDIPNAPLYTKNFGTPFKEYRAHVIFGEVVDLTQKKRLSDQEILARGMEIPAYRERLQVRTYDNGWVFSHHDIRDHESIRALAVQAAQCLNNMQMAVVDIAVQWSRGSPVRMAVIEVNTAPALRSDTTLAAYVNALRPRIEA